MTAAVEIGAAAPAPTGAAPSAPPVGPSAHPPPTIRVRHLWHRFGNFDVLRDVTFDVGPGEIFGFIGPNGAGKTTTIRVMATLLEPMAGRVEIDGVDVSIDPEAVRRSIGYMPDHAGVYDRITVREYLEFFADAFRVPSLGVVDAVLELTDLGKLQDRLVATVSKGMKQRLQLARILLHDPKVLILDEPASDLDPRARIEIRDLLLELRGLGKTIFLSSHILTELADVCTSVGILERGRLVVAGPISEIGARLERQRAAAMAAGYGPQTAPPHRSAYGRGPYPPQAYAPAIQPPRGPFPQHPQYAPGPALPPQAPYPQQAPHPQHAYTPPAFAQQPYAQQPYAQPPHAPPQPPGPQQAHGPAPAYVPPQPFAPAAQPAPHGQPGPAPGVPTDATAGGRRKVKLRVLGDPQMAAYLVRGGPGIAEVNVIGGAVHVGFVGTDVTIAEMVQHLVRNGIGVVGIEQERSELERIFLEVTRGDVQ